MNAPKRILISRCDAIGDVVLTLPLAAILKQRFPNVVIGFLGRSYTKAVIECCAAVDVFVDLNDFLQAENGANKECQIWDAIIHVFPRADIARKALQLRIPWRIGTRSRAYNWLYCNKRIVLSRKHSDLHEAQLNTKLLAPFGIQQGFSKEQLGALFAFTAIPELARQFRALLSPGKRHIILHPKSQGSAREWGLEHFEALIKLLPQEQYQVFISGTKAEGELMRDFLLRVKHLVTDITGLMDLSQFIAFIHAADALVAASTGPLHLAAALGRKAIGIYPPIRPMHPGRWAPLGPLAVALVLPDSCTACRADASTCSCIQGISPETVAALL
ncbi:MAG: glycosyltransferase family 9 protein [Bacteroidetes bacterium]|nr:glycosyltransferase family 9 protein [Bacteroidota bacterium]